MPEISDEMLMAYADGSLEPAERARVAAHLAADPSARHRLAAYELTSPAALGAFFDPLLSLPLPDHLERTIAGATPRGAASPAPAGGLATPLSRFIEALEALIPRGGSQVAFAASIAGCLAVAAVGIQWLARSMPKSAPFQIALETAQSGSAIRFSDKRGMRVITPQLTFLDKSGRYCRRYVLERPLASTLAGVACRDGEGDWRIDFEVDTGAGSTGAYTSASAGTEALDAHVSDLIDGNAFGAREEAERLRTGWRRQ